MNFRHLFNTREKLYDEPYILASQATQVYYVHDPIDRDWHAVIQSRPRDMYYMSIGEEIENAVAIDSA